MITLLLSVMAYMAQHAIDSYRACVAMAWAALTNPWTDDPHEDRLDRVSVILAGILVVLCACPWVVMAVLTGVMSSNEVDMLMPVVGFFAVTLAGRGVMRSLGRGQKWMEA